MDPCQRARSHFRTPHFLHTGQSYASYAQHCTHRLITATGNAQQPVKPVTKQALRTLMLSYLCMPPLHLFPANCKHCSGAPFRDPSGPRPADGHDARMHWLRAFRITVVTSISQYLTVDYHLEAHDPHYQGHSRTVRTAWVSGVGGHHHEHM